MDLLWKNGVSHYRIIAIDPNEPRRERVKAIYRRLLEANPPINPESTFDAIDIETAKKEVFSPNNVGFDGVVEVSLDLGYHCSGTRLINGVIIGCGELFRGFTRFRPRTSVRCDNIRRGSPRLLAPDVRSSVVWKERVA